MALKIGFVVEVHIHSFDILHKVRLLIFNIRCRSCFNILHHRTRTSLLMILVCHTISFLDRLVSVLPQILQVLVFNHHGAALVVHVDILTHFLALFICADIGLDSSVVSRNY